MSLAPDVPDPWIQVIHRSDLIGRGALDAAAQAVTIQVREHLAPAWDVGEGVVIDVVGVGEEPDPEAWWLLVADDPDVANALGYHDVTSEGRPLGKAFARPTLLSGGQISGVISHEVTEMLVDPRINEWSHDPRSGAFYATETADAVQGHDYMIGGVVVANFVLPSFFHRADPTPPYDHLEVVARPFQTMPQGYQLKYTRARGMHQVFGSRKHALLPAAWGKPTPPVGSRRERRARRHHNWAKSTPTPT